MIAEPSAPRGAKALGGIRPLERRDLPAVAGLYELVERSGALVPAPGLARHFAETFLDQPWADSKLPSLVHEERSGAISGFIGCHARRFVFDGRTIRLACAGQLVAHPTARNRAIGFFLLREFLAGNQDLSITDTATGPTPAMWKRLGGQHAHLASITWLRVFRPVRGAVDYLSTRTRRRVAGLTGSARLVTGSSARERHSSGHGPSRASEPAEASELVPWLPEVVGDLRLRPAYDEPFLTWLFGRIADVRSRGEPVVRLVRGREGNPVGWYVYGLRPGGISDVLQIAAAPRDVDEVVEDLFRHARAAGAALLRGRLEPRLLEPIARRRCLLRYNGRALIHSRDPAVVGAIEAGHALLTRMDGDYWTGHHSEPFPDP